MKRMMIIGLLLAFAVPMVPSYAHSQVDLSESWQRDFQPERWSKPHVKPGEFKRDVYECKTDAGYFRDTSRLEGIAQFSDCMEAKGWKWNRPPHDEEAK
jgi:hypothetical protein